MRVVICERRKGCKTLFVRKNPTTPTSPSKAVLQLVKCALTLPGVRSFLSLVVFYNLGCRELVCDYTSLQYIETLRV